MVAEGFYCLDNWAMGRLAKLHVQNRLWSWSSCYQAIWKCHKSNYSSSNNREYKQHDKVCKESFPFCNDTALIGIKFAIKPTSTFRQRLQQDKCLVSIATLLACLPPVKRVCRLRAELWVWILSQDPLQLLEVVDPVEGLRCRKVVNFITIRSPSKKAKPSV